MKQKDKTRKLSLIKIVILLFVLMSVSIPVILLTNITEEKIIDDHHEEKSIDNRISPLTNQGLIVELNRIRCRRLTSLLMTFGISWRKKPIYYVEIEIDNLKYPKNEIGFPYHTWDSWSSNIKVIKDVDEEQEESCVVIKIYETKNHLFTSPILRENTVLIYNYRTGFWNGSDFPYDDDGYGHFKGNNYEIWFDIYQTDYDHDGIPYWTERNILNSNPQDDDSQLDPDNDGIPTTWEWKWGYNPHIWDDHQNLDPDIDGLENIEEYRLSRWFSDPFSQDIYIEIDMINPNSLFSRETKFFEESKQIIIERFCQHGINIYIDDGWPGNYPIHGGEMLPPTGSLTWESGKLLYYYKNHFSNERKGLFRYILYRGIFPWSGNIEYNKYDTILIGTFPYEEILFHTLLFPRLQRLILSSVTLHELGHTLGITPYTIEGCDNLSFLYPMEFTPYVETWGNYKSVMNYLYVLNPLIVDYSEGNHGRNDQNDWLNIYVPFFQIEGNFIYDPDVKQPGKDNIINEDVSPNLHDWEYSENITRIFKKLIQDWSPVHPIPCDWDIYIKNNSILKPKERNLRIYARPIVPISQWSLIFEGTIDSHGNLIY